jgi:uncharacterized protein DUF2510
MTDDHIAEGWYTDSEGAIRWWDGAAWTEDVRDPSDEPEPTVVLPAARADATNRRTDSPPEPDHRRRTWLVATFVGLLTFFLGMGIGGSGNAPDPPVVEEATASSGATSEDLDKREADLKTREGELTSKQNELDQREQDLESGLGNAPSGSGAETIDNGVFEVGVDVTPGKYTSDGSDDPDLPCTYKVSSDEAGDDIITSEISDGPGNVTLAAGQFFKSEYCKTWTLQAEPKP